MWKFILCTTLLAGLFLLFVEVESCNEAVCGSVVSKCLLTQSCKCDLTNCTCCKDCYSCLNYLYSECCSCVDLCPKPNNTGTSELSKKSHVEDFPTPVPDLFRALTEGPDKEQRWNSTTFPVDFEITETQYSAKKQIKIYMKSAEQDVGPSKPTITLNCTVAFMSECMSYRKCKNSCQSMGANSYRWFHDGCCECVGEHCIKYGINESRCKDCPLIDNKMDKPNEEDLDFGEDEDFEGFLEED